MRGTEHGDARLATASLSDQHADALQKRVTTALRIVAALLLSRRLSSEPSVESCVTHPSNEFVTGAIMSKTAKALKKQAATAQSVARQTSDAFLSGQMTTLAMAFRAQADALEKETQKEEMNALFCERHRCQRRQHRESQDARTSA